MTLIERNGLLDERAVERGHAGAARRSAIAKAVKPEWSCTTSNASPSSAVRSISPRRTRRGLTRRARSRSHPDARFEWRSHPRRRAGAWRREQRDVMTARDERLAQQLDDRLDPTISRRWNRDPRRRKHSDPQGVDAGFSSRQQPQRHPGDARRSARIEDAPGAHRERTSVDVVTARGSAFGTEPSGYSCTAGSVEENNLTGSGHVRCTAGSARPSASRPSAGCSARGPGSSGTTKSRRSFASPERLAQ